MYDDSRRGPSFTRVVFGVCVCLCLCVGVPLVWREIAQLAFILLFPSCLILSPPCLSRSLWKLCCWYEEGRPSPPLTFVTFVLFVILRPGNPKPQTQVTTTLWPFCYWPTHFPVQHLASLPSSSSLFLHLLSAPLCPSTILDVSAFSPVVLFLTASFSDVVGRLGFPVCLIVLSTCAVFAPNWVACLLPALLLLPCICYCQAVTGEILFLPSRDMEKAIQKRPFLMCLCLLSVFALICLRQFPVYVCLRSSISAWHFFVGVRRSFFFLFMYGMYTAVHKDCSLCKAVCFAWTSNCFGTFYIIFLGFYFSPNVVKCLLLRTGFHPVVHCPHATAAGDVKTVPVLTYVKNNISSNSRLLVSDSDQQLKVLSLVIVGCVRWGRSVGARGWGVGGSTEKPRCCTSGYT